jgi:hypothetical protein
MMADYLNIYGEMTFREWSSISGELGQKLYREYADDNEKDKDSSVKVNELYKAKVKWKCNNGHTWEETLGNRILNKTECPTCTEENRAYKINAIYDRVNEKRLQKGSKSFLEYCKENCLEKNIREWDFERNLLELGLTIKNVTALSTKEAYWVCEKHKISYKLRIHTKIKNNGSNCSICRAEKANETRLKNMGTLIDWCKQNGEKGQHIIDEWDTEKNDKLGIKMDSVPFNSSLDAYFKCAEGHEWVTAIRNRTINGLGNCRSCKLSGKGTNLLDWCRQNGVYGQSVLKEWDEQENKEDGYKIEKIACSSKEKVHWICPNGHHYTTSVHVKTGQRSICMICYKEKLRKIQNGEQDMGNEKQA